MIIILEGCDGSGKTTLAKHLVEKYGLEYRHEGPPPPDVHPLQYYGAILDAARGKNVVFDRFALGERVYGPVLRGGTRLGKPEWRVFERLMRAVGAVQIICVVPYEVAHQNWSSGRPELFHDEEKFKQTYDMFEAFAKVGMWRNMWRYDYTSGGLWMLSGLDANAPTLPPGLIGAPNPNYLFVGDKGSDPLSKTTDLAFFGTEGSSGYLTYILDQVGVSEHECAFVNATRWDGQVLPWVIPAKKTIALGTHAVTECRRRFLAHEAIPHPQYWKRFHAHDPAGYVKLLKECL